MASEGRGPGSAVDRLASSGAGGRPPVLVLGLLLALALGAGGWATVSARDAARLDGAEREATSVARERAVDLTSYTAATFEADTAWARTGATTRFAREYAEANAPVEQVARTVDARATGTVVDAVGRATSSSEVEVLLFVDQVLVRGSDGTRSTERSRVLMSMVERDGAWLVDDVALR